MALYNSPRDHALGIAVITMDKLFDPNSKTSVILRGRFSVASLVGDTKNKNWIKNELSGYADESDVPNYRKFKERVSGVIEKYSVQADIHRIEHNLASGSPLKVWYKETKIYEMEPEWCYSILSSV